MILYLKRLELKTNKPKKGIGMLLTSIIRLYSAHRVSSDSGDKYTEWQFNIK